MTDTLFPAPDWPRIAVQDAQGSFPVRRVFCVGRNYAAHAAEMGNEVDRAAPFYFTKSALAVLPSGRSVPYPPGTSDYHHEMEFVVALGGAAFRVTPDRAMDAVLGYACGLDMTRRDLQARAKDKRHPWDLAKDAENSAVIGPITRKDRFGAIADQSIRLTVDGELRQQGKLSDMVWSVPDLIADLSRYYHLQPGDLIFTGTPSGVGAVDPGAVLRGEIDGLAPVELTLGPPEAS
ncbi:fumarylacetoacetate hydrolase family protein [uncultured Paracoccus sp.]|uniref:fumarylacetoacetate hydrolase family protein n=1 Tax=uncultured Paracoccus sp. TaxID=189685 RepID=UPI002618FA89|nr:fumarylacetoacetate hydrolase family protein [uncultured Paracoccus sp.]